MSCIITIKGTARTEHPNLEELDGIDCQDCFSDYLDDEALKQKGICGGYMRFEYHPSDQQLYTITEYQSNHLLSEQELDRLTDYTLGQWSDGIGEGFEQHPCSYINDVPIYISPGKLISATQEETQGFTKKKK